MLAFYTGPIGKYPSREVLDVSVRADLRNAPRAFDAAFHIVDVLERGTKQLLLLGAVRAPKCAVHLRTLRIQTLCEAVQSLALLMVDEHEQTRHDRYNHNEDSDFRNPWVRLRFPRSFLLFFSSLV